MANRRRARLIQYRQRQGLTQERLAQILGIEVSTVGRWERGQAVPVPPVRPRLAQALGVSLEKLDAALCEEPTPVDDRQHPKEAAPARSVAPGAQGSVCSGVEEFSAAGWGSAAEAVQAFRLADRQVGGGYLYAAVQQYLKAEMGPQLASAMSGGGVFIAAASLVEMAGWMAHDAGWDGVADRHFQRAFQLAQVGRADLLAAQVMASRSHLAVHQGRLDDAVDYAEGGWQMLNGTEDAALRARLLVMRARGYARFGEGRRCVETLTSAEGVVTAKRHTDSSTWTSPFDEASFASEAARCLCDLKDYAAATQYARRVLELRSAERRRARALARLLLARALIGQGEVEHACAHVEQVGTSANGVGSRVLAQDLTDTAHTLVSFRDNRVVGAALPAVQATAHRHRQMLNWLGNHNLSGNRDEF